SCAPATVRPWPSSTSSASPGGSSSTSPSAERERRSRSRRRATALPAARRRAAGDRHAAGEHMLIRIGQGTDHGFDQPLGLLSDCHRRIERFLGLLVAVTRTRKGGPLPSADRQALERALEYFATAGPRHSADEEESLFPR